MSDLRDLYQDVILEHSKAPRNFRELPAANHKAEGFNPLCGDHFTVYVDTRRRFDPRHHAFKARDARFRRRRRR